jgi:hypothetical protein
MSAITGVQLYIRYRDAVRLLITQRAGIDSFNIYGATSSGGIYVLLGNVNNTGSMDPQIRGKTIFGFTPSAFSWDNDTTNFVKVAPVIGIIEGVLEGPMTIPSVHDMILDRSVNILGFNKDQDRYIDVAVDTDGQLITTV